MNAKGYMVCACRFLCSSVFSKFCYTLAFLFLCFVFCSDLSRAATRHIRVVVGDNYPPFIFRDEKGVPQGIVPDLWKLYKKYNNAQVTLIVTDWNNAQSLIKNDQAEVIDAIFRTPQREKIYAFSDPYMKNVSANIFHHKSITGLGNIESLRGFVVAVLKGDAVVGILKSKGIDTFVFYDSYEDIIRDAQAGLVKIFCMDGPPAIYYLGKYRVLEKFRKGLMLYQGNVCRAALKKNSRVLQAIESGFDRIPAVEKNAVINRWMGSPLIKPYFLRYAFWLLGGFSFLMIVVLFWNFSLNSRVKKKTEEISNLLNAVYEREELVRTTLYSIADGVIATDANGNVQRMNEVAEELTGWKEGESIGKPLQYVFRVVDEDSLKKAKNPLKEVLKNGVVTGFTDHYILVSRQDTETIISYRASPIKMSDGRVVGAIIIFRNCTAERESQLKLEHTLEQLNLALDSANLAVLHANLPEGKLFYDNRWISMLGLEDGGVGISDLSDWKDILHPDDKDDFFSAFNNHILGYSSLIEGEFRVKHSSGYWKWIYIKGKVIEYDKQKKPVLCSGVAVDITEQKIVQEKIRTLEEQLAHATRLEAVGKLAGGIAHDFNNVLQIILGHSELALAKVERDSTPHQHITEVIKASHKAAKVIQQLLSFARKGISNPKVTNLNAVIQNAVPLFSRFIGEQIELDLRLHSNLWNVLADATQMEQILVNLIINARDAITDNGLVIVETANETVSKQKHGEFGVIVPGEYVRLSIIDNGHGMTKEIMDRMFEPFFTTKEDGKGTGLGLSMVYGIVKQNNGVIDVCSQIGKGTRIDIYLPKCDVSAKDSDKTKIGEDTVFMSEEQKTILLVEDDKDILFLLGQFLRMHGFKVICFVRPSEALNWLDTHRMEKVDLLITDVVMPELSGPQLWNMVKSKRPDVQCLFISGYADDSISKYKLPSDTHFLRKPYSTEELLFKIASILKSFEEGKDGQV